MRLWTIDLEDKARMTVFDYPEIEYFCLVLQPKGCVFPKDRTGKQLLARLVENEMGGGVSDRPHLTSVTFPGNKSRTVIIWSDGNQKKDFEAAAVIARHLIEGCNLTGEELEKMAFEAAPPVETPPPPPPLPD